jgi:hypothetical protein
LELFNSDSYYEPPETQECETCEAEWDGFMELEECDDCGEGCCLKCSIEVYDMTLCYECITQLYAMTGREVDDA